jgi:hypothetical protein
LSGHFITVCLYRWEGLQRVEVVDPGEGDEEATEIQGGPRIGGVTPGFINTVD